MALTDGVIDDTEAKQLQTHRSELGITNWQHEKIVEIVKKKNTQAAAAKGSLTCTFPWSKDIICGAGTVKALLLACRALFLCLSLLSCLAFSIPLQDTV